MVVFDNMKYEILGPKITSSTKELVDYVLYKENVLVSQVATELGISVQNASTRLKKLVADGYILRTESIAESGGIEYRYNAIK